MGPLLTPQATAPLALAFPAHGMNTLEVEGGAAMCRTLLAKERNVRAILGYAPLASRLPNTMG